MTEATIYGVNVAEFVTGYLAAMLWSSNDDNDTPLDSAHGVEDMTAEARERAEVECRAFLYRVGFLITEENFLGARPDGGTLAGYAGHDFWLTRVGHGAGFWDGDWTNVAGEWMTREAKTFGELNPFVTEDGRVAT